MGRKVELPPPAPVRLKNYIALVIDESGSMLGLESAIKAGYAKLREQLQAKVTTDPDQDTLVSLYTFNGTVMHRLNPCTPQRMPVSLVYHPKGQTALYAACAEAITDLRDMPDAHEEHVSFLIVVMTDGYENASFSVTTQTLRTLIATVTATGRWTLAFQVPDPACKRMLIGNLELAPDNVTTWEATERGVAAATGQTVSGVNTFYTSRASGLKAMTTFYVNTDLSKLSAKDVYERLDNVQMRYSSFAVEREIEIRDFVERETAQAYRIGTAFYQLTKPEKIQPGKQILIVEKGARAIYGGAQARDLIGLPHGGDAKVVPGNHANWDIFVQSTSTNRKLVRGTRLLVQKVRF